MAAIDEPPDWITGRDGGTGAVFYQIFPDRFARSGRVDVGARLEPWDAPPTFTGYKGGDLWGVIDRLDYLVELGINALYLNPVFQSASNHRYHTHDYFTVDPMLGGDDAFDALLEAAHGRSMRVVLDGVFNHASRGFFQFSDIAEHQEKSAYVDWFRVDEFPIRPYDEDVPPTYDAWWGLHALPAFNTENEVVREFLWRVGEYWIGRGVDGWRLDVPNEIRTPGFWEEFRKRVRAVNPDAYIVGEIWGPAQEWVGDSGRFDGVMNYELTTATIAFAVGDNVEPATALNNNEYSITPARHAGQLADHIDWLASLYDTDSRLAMLNLLDSHDTSRIRSIAGGDTDLVVLALAMMLTMPGAPCLYYGTEIGMEGGPDPDCRRGFPEDEASWDMELLDVVRTLIALRHQLPGLRAPGVERIGPPYGQDFGDTYVYGRGCGEERVVVAINRSDATDVVPLDGALAADAEQVFGAGSIVTVDEGTEVHMPPRSAAIWKAPSS